MKILPISDIVVSPTRQRRHFDPVKMQEFAAGIQNRGLLHAITLREVGGKLQLVAGERRLRAVEMLASLSNSITYEGAPVPLGSIPYTLFTDLSPLAAEEAEYEENCHREDLTWAEKAAATARLQAFRTTQAAALGALPPSVADLAAETRGSSEGSYHEATRRELVVAQHLGKPEIAAAKSLDEAYKLLKREEATERNRALGESVGRTFTSNVHRVLNTDSIAWMKAADAGQFDVILTDPPYGMGADEFGDSGGMAAGAHGYADSIEFVRDIQKVAALHFGRLCKPQAHAYIFCDVEYFEEWKHAMQAGGWSVFRTPLIWHKSGGNPRAPWPDQGPQRRYECCLYAVKGKRKVQKMAADLVSFPPDENLGHSAQKPVALFEELLSRSVYPGDSVLDPFAGTGVTLAAAHALKCRATVIEIDPASYGIAVARLKKLDAQAELQL